MAAHAEAQGQKHDWKSLIAEKRSSNLAKIPQAWRLDPSFLDGVNENARKSVLDVPRKCGILTADELDITEKYSAEGLVQAMVQGKLTSEAVVTAFCKRAAIAQQLTNCLTEIMFTTAIASAKAADAHLAQTGQPLGPLHGLPISFKDSFNIKGVASTIGYVSYLARPPCATNSALVDIVLSLGGIPFVKTNLPQSMMTADSENHIFGRTLNPNRLNLTAGGSTGGEGALVRMRGSPLGLATDIAGSIRIPAMCNGVFGFKPSAGRMPFVGKTPPGRLGSPSSILPVIGPEANDVRDLEFLMREVLLTRPWVRDPFVANVPWRKVEQEKKGELRLGFLLEDRKTPVHPPVLKMMQTVKKELEKAGVKVVDITEMVPSLYDNSVLAWKYFLLDPKKTPMQIMKEGEEELIKSVGSIAYPELDGWEASLEELFQMNVERAGVVKQYHDIVVENNLDGFIMPAYQSTAPPHDTYGQPPYTVLANLIDYPATSIPYLKASKEEDKAFVRAGVTYRTEYDPDAIEGAPCGFQVVGRPLEDEELLKTSIKVATILSAGA